MKKKIKEETLQDVELLCMNVVETINGYFDRFPKGMIKKNDYLKMVEKISFHLIKMEEEDLKVYDKPTGSASYIG